MHAAVEQLERENATFRERVDKTLASRGEERLLLFRQVHTHNHKTWIPG